MTAPASGQVRWVSGFWADRFQQVGEVTIPHIWAAMQLERNGAVYGNLRAAAGLEKAEFHGKNWSDGDFFKWLESVAHVYAITHDAALDRKMDELIEVIGKAQAPDGYISTQVQLRPGRNRWTNRGDHELYNMGHLIAAACAHHRATGKRNLLRIAIRNADYLYGVFAPRPPALAHFCFNPSQIMSLVELYRVTGEPRYLKLAGIFVDMRGSQPGGTDFTQDRVSLRDETEAVGHAVTAAYLWAGATDVYAETGETALWKSLDRMWRDVVDRKMLVTGGLGVHQNWKTLRRDPVGESFGLPYQLPVRTAYSETCANIGNAMWNRRLLEITGDARYTEIMELALYNSMLSALSADGTAFFYTNPLRRVGQDLPLQRNDWPVRWPNNDQPGMQFGFCCPPSIARTIAQLHDWAYSLSPEGVWVHLFGSNRLDTNLPGGGRLRLRQQTGYPWQGNVRLSFDEAPGRAFSLMLRVPSWAGGSRLTVNGEPVAAAAGSYVNLRRVWAAGDAVVLDMPLDPRLVEASPWVDETRNQVAVMRGPLVYALESPDLPAGVSIFDVAIPAGVRFTPRFDPRLLGGVSVLEGTALRAVRAPFGDSLYRLFRPVQPESVPIRLIPYYAWANRGVSHMTVWLPLTF